MSIQKLETVCEPAKETAKKIRTALKINFPNTKFSVRTDVYSGGSSVNVSWNDLPLVDEVETVVNQFKSGSFDGMTDMYETTGYIMDGKRFVGAKYIFTSRKLSDERKQLIKDWMKENYCEVDENSYDYYYHFNKAEELMIKEETKQLETVEQTEVKENNLTIENNDNITVELIHNEEKNGLELKFTGCPSEGTRQLLKENGFRWSKYSKVWWVTKTDKSLLFAESFVSAFNDTIEPEEAEQPIINEVPEVVEVENNPYNQEIKQTVNGYYCHMKAWNMEPEQIETRLNALNIPYLLDDEKFFFLGITLEQFKLVKSINENNEAILFDDSFDTEYVEHMKNNVNPEPVTEETTNEPTYNQDGKIKVKSITFLWSESAYIQDNQTVNTFSEAEQLIHNAAIQAPKDGCYDKTKFTITWTDGQTYTGRIDIQYKHTATIKPLQSHILQFANSVINDDGSFHNDEERESYKQFIDTYSLSDDQLEQPTNKGKVLDFNSKFKQRQAENERQQALNYFTDNILPYLSFEDKTRLLEAQENKEKFNNIMYELMLKSKAERLKQK